MDLMDLLILFLLVLSTPAVTVPREFHLVSMWKTWTEAQSYCRENFFDLVTIESAEDWARVRNILGDLGVYAAWIGLYDDVKSWRWSMDNTSLYEGESGSWFVFDEDNVGSREHCALVYQGELQDANCEQSLWFVCYDETSYSFIQVKETKSWQGAQSYCRQTYTDLASIRNQQEWNDVMAEITAVDRYWIGLSRESWKWSDQLPPTASFRQWGVGEPHGESCGGAKVNGMYDWYCDRTSPFICSALQRKVVKVLKVTVKTDGSVNLNDPLVRAAALKQVEKDLRGQGVHQEFSLKWRKKPHGDVFNKTQL